MPRVDRVAEFEARAAKARERMDRMRQPPSERLSGAGRDALERIMPTPVRPGVQAAQALDEALKADTGFKKPKAQKRIDEIAADVERMTAEPLRRVTAVHIKRLVRAVRAEVLTAQQADAVARTGRAPPAPEAVVENTDVPAKKPRKKRKTA